MQNKIHYLRTQDEVKLDLLDPTRVVPRLREGNRETWRLKIEEHSPVDADWRPELTGE